MSRDNILIIGADSYIGCALIEFLKSRQENLLGTSRRLESEYIHFDLSDNISVLEKILIQHQFSAVIFLAAITGEANCTSDESYSHFINVEQTKKAITLIAKQQVFTVFMSTSMVFDHSTAFIEYSSAYSPKSVYGRQKAEVESYLTKNDFDTAILRVGKVIGGRFPLFDNLIKTEEHCLTLFDDHFAAPISLNYLCQLIYDIVNAKVKGIYQCSGNKDISYAQMAKVIVDRLQVDVEIKAISAIDKGVSPERFGSLHSHCPASFEIVNQCFSQVVDDYIAASRLFSPFLNKKD